MSHKIELPDELYEKLKFIAEPFVDTPISVIAKLVDIYETNMKLEKSTSYFENQVKILDPFNPGSLAFTKVLEAKFEDETASKWFDLAKVSHIVASGYLDKSFNRLSKLSKMNISEGAITVKGFDYLKEINVSIQRADANVTWRNVLRIAKELSLPVSVRVVWRDRPGAAYPNTEGLLAWSPHSQTSSDD